MTNEARAPRYILYIHRTSIHFDIRHYVWIGTLPKCRPNETALLVCVIIGRHTSRVQCLTQCYGAAFPSLAFSDARHEIVIHSMCLGSRNANRIYARSFLVSFKAVLYVRQTATVSSGYVRDAHTIVSIWYPFASSSADFQYARDVNKYSRTHGLPPYIQ